MFTENKYLTVFILCYIFFPLFPRIILCQCHHFIHPDRPQFPFMGIRVSYVATIFQHLSYCLYSSAIHVGSFPLSVRHDCRENLCCSCLRDDDSTLSTHQAVAPTSVRRLRLGKCVPFLQYRRSELLLIQVTGKAAHLLCSYFSSPLFPSIQFNQHPIWV